VGGAGSDNFLTEFLTNKCKFLKILTLPLNFPRTGVLQPNFAFLNKNYVKLKTLSDSTKLKPRRHCLTPAFAFTFAFNPQKLY